MLPYFISGLVYPFQLLLAITIGLLDGINRAYDRCTYSHQVVPCRLGLRKLSTKELKATAKTWGKRGYSKMTKSELLDLLAV